MVLLSELARREIVEQAMHSNRMEGLESTPELKADMELWIKGKITIDELIEKTLARYRKGEISAVEIKG